MPTNVYAPKTEEVEIQMIKRGFRWCNKDQRWECRRKLTPAERQALMLDVPEAGIVTESSQDEMNLEDE